LEGSQFSVEITSSADADACHMQPYNSENKLKKYSLLGEERNLAF
jgi:hypothetical protein